MILYFSGTGNSAYAAKFLAEKLSDTVMDITVFFKDSFTYLSSEKPWVVVAPIYAWQMAHIVRDWLLKIKLNGNRDIYFVLTCGGDMGNAAKYVKELSDNMGMNYKGCAELVMPENYIIMFNAPDKAHIDVSVALAEDKLVKMTKLKENSEPIPEKKTGMLDGFKSGAVNNGFYKLFVNDKKFYAKDNCVSCGLCEKKCPMDNIKLVSGKPQWGGNCTQCMACICKCPVDAIEYGSKTVGKARYCCPKA